MHGAALVIIMRQAGCNALQVVYDVTGGIADAAKRDIAHRDITPNIFGQLAGRGYLYDFSAAKVFGQQSLHFVVQNVTCKAIKV